MTVTSRTSASASSRRSPASAQTGMPMARRSGLKGCHADLPIFTGRQSSWNGGQLLRRIDRLAVVADLEVQLGPLGLAGAAREADALALADVLAFGDGDLAEEAVGGVPAVAVIDDDDL